MALDLSSPCSLISCKTCNFNQALSGLMCLLRLLSIYTGDDYDIEFLTRRKNSPTKMIFLRGQSPIKMTRVLVVPFRGLNLSICTTYGVII